MLAKKIDYLVTFPCSMRPKNFDENRQLANEREFHGVSNSISAVLLDYFNRKF